MNDLIGQKIKRYLIIEKIAEGGTATVYKARDLVLERYLAIKIIYSDLKNTDPLLKRLKREAKILASLKHENIIPILDYGEFEGMFFLVMPFISGGTLEERISGSIPYDEAAKLLVPITEALKYAHDKGIIHRDIKPSNILIDETGKPILTDFGIAKAIAFEETSDLTGTEMIFGTPEYMSPEQCMGKLVDGRSDEYSLGVVFYELITGRKPYQGDNPLSVALKQNTEPLPSPRKFKPELPRKVERFIIKSLSKNPDERFQTLDIFREELLILSNKNIPESRFLNRSSLIWILSFLVVIGSIPVFLGAIKQHADVSPVTTSTPPIVFTKPATITPIKIGTKTKVPPTSTATIPPTPTLGQGSSQSSLKDGMEMVFVPAGSFLMGSLEGEGDPDEYPEHEVFLDAFWIDKTEVTNAMFQKCVDVGYCEHRQDNSSNTREKYFRNPEYADFPVVNVRGADYCAWVGKRLPTEAEWEKAAGGSSLYPWGDLAPDSTRGNFNKENNDTTRVGSYPEGASIYGALDMAGNVWEWVSDIYESDYYQKSPPINPKGTNKENLHEQVRRGGSYLSNSNAIRNSERVSGGSYSSNKDVGFRCVLPGMDLIPTKTPQMPTPSPLPEQGKTQVSNTDGVTMIFIPKGEFLMGSNEDITLIDPNYNFYYHTYQYDDLLTDEHPIHTVYLDAFWIDQTEVTNKMFLNFINATGYKAFSDWRHPEGPTSGLSGRYEHPVVNVSRNDANAYCQWAGRRLPSEAEWEKAARGTSGATYPWGETPPDLTIANYDNGELNGYKGIYKIGHATNVGSYQNGISPYGLFDMAGNVSEWVWDIYNPDYYFISPDNNPLGPSSGSEGVIRGGSFLDDARFLRTASRINSNYSGGENIGFRCAMDASE